MPRCEISKEIEFDAGHRVPGHIGKCRNPHGHRYRVRVTCEGNIIEDKDRSDHGMLVDFGDLKTIMKTRIHDRLDHGFMVYVGDAELMKIFYDHDWKIIEFGWVPTAENIARWIWLSIKRDIEQEFGDDLHLTEVAVWETPTSVAYYRGN